MTRFLLPLLLGLGLLSGCGPSPKEIREIAESLTPLQQAMLLDAYCCKDSRREICAGRPVVPGLSCNTDGSFSISIQATE